MNDNPKGSYAEVNGLELYYEIHGEGALILLHGGVGASEMFGANLPELAESRQVIAVHLQAHGHTADVDRPMTFEAMADDIAALISHLGFEQADVMGWSLGGSVALQTAIRHPERVRKLVLVSIPFKRDGWYPEVLAGMSQTSPETADMTQPALRPLPEHRLAGATYEAPRAAAARLRLVERRRSSEDADDARLRRRRRRSHRARHGVLWPPRGRQERRRPGRFGGDPRAGSPSCRARHTTTWDPLRPWRPPSLRSSRSLSQTRGERRRSKKGVAHEHRREVR